MRHLNRLSVSAFALVLVSAACSDSSSPSTPTTEHPPAKFVEGPCAKTPEPVPLLANARCGELVVPVNRTKPDSATLRLAIAIIPSETQPPTKEPIVFLQGGPGLDGIASPAVAPNAGLNHDRDLILFGQRGTQTSSTSLVCTEQDKFFAARVGLVYDAPSTGDLDAKSVKECRDRLAPTTDLAAYNSTESAYDLIDMRKALGLEKWAVFSHSYGTTLALIYLNMDGAAVTSVVFDGTTPPSVGGMAWTWQSARAAFDGVMQACAAQPACKARYPDLGATFIRLVDDLEKNPVTTTVDIPGHGPTKVVLDGGTLLAWFVGMSGRLTAGIPAAIDELDHGSPETVATQYAAGWVNTDLSNSTVATGLTLGIWCSEWVPYETAQESMSAAKKAFPDFPDSVLEQAPQLAFLREECTAWNVPKAPESIRNITKSDVPALVITGSFDARTGPMWGEYIAKDLSHSTVVVVPGWGHGVFLNPCGAKVIASFFGNPAKPDTSCVDTVQIDEFTILPPRQ